MIELIGWIGFLYLTIGYILNAKKEISCFFFWIIGNILLMSYAIVIKSNPQIATAFIVLIMNLYGYVEWRKNG